MPKTKHSIVAHKRSMIVAVALGVVLAGVAVATGQDFDLPDFVTAEEQIPVQLPDSGQQVAVLDIHLEMDADGVVSAELASSRVIDSFTPKSAARTGGDWEVRVLGERPLTFEIPNPLLVEVENPDNEVNPFDTLLLDAYEWTLVVPLYDDTGPLNATEISVVDLETGATILASSIRSA